jgi:hypothetical protein
MKETFGNVIVRTFSQYLFCDIQLLICSLFSIHQRLLVSLCEVLNMCFLDHGLAVSDIEDMVFIESGCHCNFCSCFEPFNCLCDFKSEYVNFGELKVDFTDLILRKHRWV